MPLSSMASSLGIEAGHGRFDRRFLFAMLVLQEPDSAGRGTWGDRPGKYNLTAFLLKS